MWIPLLLLAPLLQDTAPAQDTVSAQAEHGYNLISPLMSTRAHLIDMQGRICHTWECEQTPGNSLYLMPDGDLLRAARPESNPVFRGGGEGGRLQRIAWDGTVLWDYQLNTEDALHHHDFEPLPNGNLLLIAWESKTPEEAIGLGRLPDHVGPAGVWPDWILEIRPTPPAGAEVVWEWHTWDHLVQDHDPQLPNYGDPADFPGRVDINHATKRIEREESDDARQIREREEQRLRAMGYAGGDDDEPAKEDDAEPDEPRRRDVRGADWMHSNGIDYDPELDLIVLSVRAFDEVWVIDHSTTTEQAAGSTGGRHGRGGDLLWRFGNPEAHGMGGEEEQRLFKQHDPTFVRTDGRLGVLCFNNGNGRPGGNRSSADEVPVPLAEDGTVARMLPRAIPAPEQAAWSHRLSRKNYSHFISGALRLDGGNTLICSGEKGRLVEVTPEGEVVWRYQNTHGGDAMGSRGGAKPDPRAEEIREAAAQRGHGIPRKRRGGGGGPTPTSLFRATRVPFDHPGLEGKDLAPRED